MKLSQFEIKSIEPLFRHTKPPFARCKVRIGVRDKNNRSHNLLDLDLVMTEVSGETLEALQVRTLAQARRVLEAAGSLLAEHEIPALHAIVDADNAIVLADFYGKDDFE